MFFNEKCCSLVTNWFNKDTKENINQIELFSHLDIIETCYNDYSKWYYEFF